MSFSKSYQEILVAERKGFSIVVGNYPTGDPKNRIIIRPAGNQNPTKDIVFTAVVEDEKLILQYPLYFKLEKMFLMLEFISNFEREIITLGNKIWKS